MASKFLTLAVLALLAASAFAQGSSTQVKAPGTQVNTQSTQQGSNTQVKAPGTNVTSTPQGTTVKAPGTNVATNRQGTFVTAPAGTGVVANHQTGSTSVGAAGTKVDVAPNGATVVDVPYGGVGKIFVPGGRKMLQA